MKNFNMNTMTADTMTANSTKTEKSRGLLIAESITAILACALMIGLLLFHPDKIDSFTTLIAVWAGSSLFSANKADIKKAVIPASIATALAAAVIIAVKGIWILNICYLGTLPFVFLAAMSASILVKLIRK